MFEDNYRQRGLRNKLVRLLRQKGITDERVLTAIGKVPRHVFFENAFLEHAYQDKAFPIGEGQTISQPYTVAFQTEKLMVQPGQSVLEVGTGSGYQACILLELGARVYTIEYNRVLFEKARKLLPKMGYRPHFHLGDGSKGLPAFAPYHRILVTAGAPVIPEALTAQLADEGLLIIPVGDREKQVMVRITKKGNKLIREDFDYFSFVPLLGEQGWKK
ncbi:MAG: protein-L-isoaspartate O-methyltransferase [Cyclobacteriaceae bacterium]|nr:MAG: protein-L-isoaspartate O-methyltransferase [Cyclobacteriaceae bacterium]